jgi:hypothetical protein
LPDSRDPNHGRRTSKRQKQLNDEIVAQGVPASHHLYTVAEDARILAHTERDRVLAVELGRSLYAIRAQRRRLKAEDF